MYNKEKLESIKMRDFDRIDTAKTIKKAHDTHPIKIIKNSEEYVVIVNYDVYLKLLKGERK